MTIFEAIPKIMADLKAIGRDEVNQSQRFKYRGLDSIYNALHGLLAKHGVFTVPEVLEERQSERTSKSGGILIQTILKIRYMFYSSDGTNVSAVVIGEAMDSGDKGANKAESAAHKYALTQVFCIQTQDQEADAESHEIEEPKKKALDFIFPFPGPWKGKRLGELTPKDLFEYVDDMIQQAKKAGKELKPQAQELVWATNAIEEDLTGLKGYSSNPDEFNPPF